MDHSPTLPNLSSPTQNVEQRCSSMTTTCQNTQCISMPTTTTPSATCNMKEWYQPSFTPLESSNISKDRDGSWSEIEPMDTWQQHTTWRPSETSEEEILNFGKLMESMPISKWTDGEEPNNDQTSFGSSIYLSSMNQPTTTDVPPMEITSPTNS